MRFTQREEKARGTGNLRAKRYRDKKDEKGVKVLRVDVDINKVDFEVAKQAVKELITKLEGEGK